MAMRLMFGFETGLSTEYWVWTGPHYVSSGDPQQQKVLPAWSDAQARTGGWSAHLDDGDEQIEFDPLMELHDRCWYTFGIRFSNVSPASDTLFLQIRNEDTGILDVLLTPQSKIRAVRTRAGAAGRA